MKKPGLLMALCTALLWGCADDLPLPTAQPLITAAAVIEELPGAMPGTLAVAMSKDLELAATDDQRAIRFNLYYPASGDNYPLLIFSHGNWSNKDSYDNIIKHWVSHGYTVIAPDHLDCCSMAQGIFNSVRYGQLGLITARVDDIKRVRSALDTIAVLEPGFAGKADSSRVAMTGHSFGAFTAQQFGGAGTFDPDAEEFLYFTDPSIKAVVAISPPGPMFDTITADSWLNLTTPNLATTGTWDIQPTFWPDWRMHLSSYDQSPSKDKYALVIQGADHYFGNLICRPEREEAPQHDAFIMLKVATTNFLNAYVKNNTEARAFLESEALQSITDDFAQIRSHGARPH